MSRGAALLALPVRLARTAWRVARSWPAAWGLEGSWRGPFAGIGELGGTYELGRIEDGWQRNLAIATLNGRRIPAVYACVMANARGISQCYPAHKRRDADGNVTTVTTSAASRVLRRPNPIETWPQFILNLVAEVQFDGNAMAVAVRNARGEVTKLWRLPRTHCSPLVSADGSIFYAVGVNVFDPEATEMILPARDVLHLRLHTPRHPLLGESPITAAAMAAGINVALSASQLAFFTNMSRPSGVLSTDQPLTSADIEVLRQKMEEASKRWMQGGLPILSRGIKFLPMSINSQDAQLIEAQRLSIEDIARVFGVPLPVIGELTKATLQNVEHLANLWLAIGLGALLENVERSFDALFELDQVAAGNEWIEFDTAALLRTDFAALIDGLTKGIQGGLFAPNEARARMSLSPVPHGETVYVQQQMVPLGTQPAAPPATGPAPAPGGAGDAGAADDTVGDGSAADGGDSGGAAPDDAEAPGARAVPAHAADELDREIAHALRALTDDEAIAILRASATETLRALERARAGAVLP